MAGETLITVVGNLTADPELRHTQSGLAVCNGTVASTARTFNRQSNQWEDGEPLFLRWSVWREYAENAAASLHKGDRVIVQGKLKQREYEDREGNKRTAYELDVEEIGPALRYAQAQVTRNAPKGQGGGQWAQGPSQGAGSTPSQGGGDWGAPGGSSGSGANLPWDDTEMPF